MDTKEDLFEEIDDPDRKRSISQNSVKGRRTKSSRFRNRKNKSKSLTLPKPDTVCVEVTTTSMENLFIDSKLDDKEDVNSEKLELENDESVDNTSENNSTSAADVLSEMDELSDHIDETKLSLQCEESLRTVELENDFSKENTLESRFSFNNFELNDEVTTLDGQMSNAPVVNELPNEKEKSGENSEDDPESATSQIQYNEKFLTLDSKTYGVENFSKSAMVIFNHYEIDGYDRPRTGTHIDVDALKDTFLKLGFIINDYIDLTKKEINSRLEEFSSLDFTDYGCVAVVALTHGSAGGYIRAKDRSYHESMIIDHFFNKNNKTLVTKPKVFIFQACRGTKVSQAQMVGLRSAMIQHDAGTESQIYTLPTEADVLILHSTYAGDVAHRVENEGSWFIQTLCKHINTLADTMDLEAIMMEVKMDVAVNKTHVLQNRRTGKTDMNKQMPVVMSTLIRKLYLKSPPTSVIDFEKPTYTAPITFEQNTDERNSKFPTQHFIYMRNALRVFHSKNASPTGGLLLDIADAMEANAEPESTTRMMAKKISEYLKSEATDWKYFNLIFFES